MKRPAVKAITLYTPKRIAHASFSTFNTGCCLLTNLGLLLDFDLLYIPELEQATGLRCTWGYGLSAALTAPNSRHLRQQHEYGRRAEGREALHIDLVWRCSHRLIKVGPPFQVV